MQVVILAGGLATRLGELTRKIPKSMVGVEGKPFLEHQLALLKRNKVGDVVLCLGHLGEQIEAYFGDGHRFGINIRYSYERQGLLGTAGALKNAEGLLEDTFYTMYGDSYLFLDFAGVMAYFRQQAKLALMTVHRNYDRYERSNTVVEGSLVKYYSKKEKTPGMTYIEYGANIFRKETLRLVPADQPYSLEELVHRLIGKRELLAYEVKERFYQIGSAEGLAEFKEYISREGVKP